MKSHDLELVSFSVLASVESPTKHRYVNVHPLILKMHSIAPEEWEWVEEAFITDSSSHSIVYNNTTLVYASEEMIASAHGKKGSDSLGPTDFVTKYIRELAVDTFRKAQLYWNFHVPLGDPNSWLAERFFCPEVHSRKWVGIELNTTLTLDTDGLLNTFKFSPNAETGVLEINCICGPILFADDDDLIRWISRHHELKSEMFINLAALMGLDND